MKFLFSPYGLALLLLVAAILFFPRRAPDQAKRFGKPMRAFDEETQSVRDDADPQGADDSAAAGDDDSTGGVG